MILRSLRIQNFRNHQETSFEFTPGVNLLLGENGQGKTNVLEAISYLCLTKSFFELTDSLVVRFGSERFVVDGKAFSTSRGTFDVRVVYSEPLREKVFLINKQRIEPFSSVIGTFPVVVCSPEHAPITNGGPTERRRFVDFVASQSNGLYFRELLEYRKVIRQRNRILLDARMARRDPGDQLEPWNHQLVLLGSALTWKRHRFANEFQEFLDISYRHLVGDGEEPSIGYRPRGSDGKWASEEDVRTEIADALEDFRAEELRIGTTLVGPHRDEFDLKINGRDLRKFASQGQHKTFLVALKLSEFYFLKDRCGEAPLLLLDDVFSELDGNRAKHLLEFTSELSQTFVTSTDPKLFDNAMSRSKLNKKFLIQNGSIVEEGTMQAA